MIGDDDLRDRLRRTDPAAALAPAAPDQVRQLVEEAMSRTHTRRWALPVAAALVLIAGGAGWAAFRDGEPAPEAKAPATATSSATVTASGSPVPARVTMPEGGAAKCVEPTAVVLAERADYAFAGTVAEVNGRTVVLEVTRTYRGAATGRVELAQSSGASEQMLGSGRFEIGTDYLVAASEGNVLICGYSGEADSIGLRDLYEAAF